MRPLHAKRRGRHVALHTASRANARLAEAREPSHTAKIHGTPEAVVRDNSTRRSAGGVSSTSRRASMRSRPKSTAVTAPNGAASGAINVSRTRSSCPGAATTLAFLRRLITTASGSLDVQSTCAPPEAFYARQYGATSEHCRKRGSRMSTTAGHGLVTCSLSAVCLQIRHTYSSNCYPKHQHGSCDVVAGHSILSTNWRPQVQAALTKMM